MKDGRIITDNYGVTSEQGIYAIGDVTGSPWLAHKASHEGIRCVEHICNPKLSIKHKIIIPLYQNIFFQKLIQTCNKDNFFFRNSIN